MLQLLDTFPKGVGRGNVFCAYASGITPAVYSATAQTGPLLWNGGGSSRGVTAYLLAVGFGLTTAATTAAAVLGVTGNSGQSSAPTSTTAITLSGNLYLGNDETPVCSVYNAGTVSSGGDVFLPFAQVHLGATSVDTVGVRWVELGGAVVLSPGAWASVAAFSTVTAGVLGFGLVWAEAPN